MPTILQPKQHDIFLNFGFADRAACDRIYTELELYGLNVWRCTEQIQIGDFQREINKAIKRARVFVALLSGASQQDESNAVKEIKFAVQLRQEMLRAKKQGESVEELHIILFHLDAARVCSELEIPTADLHRINVGTKNWKKGIPDLLKAIDKALDTSGAPAPPRPSPTRRVWKRSLILLVELWISTLTWIYTLLGEGFRIIFVLAAIFAIIGGVAWWKFGWQPPSIDDIVPGPEPIVKDKQPEPKKPMAGIVEFASTGIRVVCTTMEYDTVLSRASEPENAKSKRIIRSGKAKFVYDAGSKTFESKSVLDAIEDAKGFMKDAEKEAQQPIEWLAVLSSGFQSAKSPEVIGELRGQLSKGLGCEVHAATEEEIAVILYKGIVPAAERDRGSSIAIEVGSNAIKGSFFEKPKYKSFVDESIPGPFGLGKAKENLKTTPVREKYAVDARKAAQGMIRWPLENEAEQLPFYAGAARVYLVGDTVRILCRLARPDVPVDQIEVNLDFSADIKEFRRIVLDGGEDGVATPLTAGKKEAYEADRREALKAFSPDQLINAVETLDALKTGLSLDKGNRTVIFRQSAMFEWSVEFLRRKVEVKRKAKGVALQNEDRHGWPTIIVLSRAYRTYPCYATQAA